MDTNEASRVHSLRADSFLEGVVEKKLISKRQKIKPPIHFIHASMHLCILTALHHLPKDWILLAKHSSSVYWHIKIKLRVLLSYIDILPLVFLCLHQGHLRWNGHWFSFFTSRPSPMEWSLIFLCSHQGPLRWNGHWFSFFTSRPSPMEW